jgi:hypothetical protein
VDDWGFSGDGLHLNRGGARHLGQLFERVCGVGGGGPERRGTWPRTAERSSSTGASGLQDSPAEIRVVGTVENASQGKSLVMLQVNCRSICNKLLEFWNLIETYNPDVVIGTESWLHEEINNAELFRGDYIIFRRDRCSRGGGVFICVKNHIDCREL